MPLIPGQMLNNRYRIVKLLGQGGFGAVYKAWDTNLNHPVAVKENFDTSPASQNQFLREASILANLRHPNLPVVIDHFTLPGQGQYLVMDYIEGEDLEELRIGRGGRLDEAQVLPWIGQVLDALAYMHVQQPAVIHRDIKPANIKITSDPAQPTGKAMLVDFGVAKVVDPSQRTLTGARAVTPGYAPFEQYGQAPTDARTDIYALGATLYTVLTGEVPVESLQRMAGAVLPAPRSLNPNITPEIENVIQVAMQVKPEQRFQSAVHMKSVLFPPVVPPIAQPIQQLFVPEQPIATWPVNPAASAQVMSQPEMPGQINPPRPMAYRWIIGIVLLLLVGVIYLASQQIISTTRNRNTTRTLSAVAEALTNTPRSTHTSTSVPTPLFTGTTTSTGTVTPTATVTSIPTLKPGTTLVSPQDGMVLVYIPAGEFMMGALDSDTNAANDEKPRHKVFLDAFWMYQTEVTNAMYEGCVNKGFCPVPLKNGSITRPTYFRDSLYKNYPVIFMSWYNARDYCQWAGVRLPTEAEWEKATRGGLEGKIYPWGDEAPLPCIQQVKNGANIADCNHDTTPVGYFLPNGYGLFDMVGNVDEWVADWYGETYYDSIPADAWPTNPSGPLSGFGRVMRGGSWGSDDIGVRVSYRFSNLPGTRYSAMGIRCVRSP